MPMMSKRQTTNEKQTFQAILLLQHLWNKVFAVTLFRSIIPFIDL